MDETTLDEALGDLYSRHSVVTCPTQFGFHTRRPRRYNLLLLKDTLFGCKVENMQRGQWQPYFLCTSSIYTWSLKSIRPTQYIVSILIFQILDIDWASSHPACNNVTLRFSEQMFHENVGIDTWFDSMRRTADYSWRSYMVASFDSLMTDLSWVPCMC